MEQLLKKISHVLERYAPKVVLVLLQEVALVAAAATNDGKIDWNELVKKTSTGITSAREYQMLWRYLAYRHYLADDFDKGAETPLGTVVLIFQPAEEAGKGAKQMIEEGALQDVKAIFAVHVSHEHPTGTIGSRPGPLLAGCGFFKAVITGGVDPVLAASAAVISLQGIVSREADPLDSQVVSVASFNGGNNHETIPDTVTIGGTFRAFSNTSFYHLLQRIKEVIIDQASVFRCTAAVDFFEKDYTILPPTVNDDRMYEHVRKVAIDSVGTKNFRVVQPMMGAEDFSFYSAVVPSAFFYIGIRNETLGSVHTGHSPHFMIDENVLSIGATIHASIAERYLMDHR